MERPKMIDEILGKLILGWIDRGNLVAPLMVEDVHDSVGATKKALAEWIRSRMPLVAPISKDLDVLEVSKRMAMLDAIRTFEQALLADLEDTKK